MSTYGDDPAWSPQMRKAVHLMRLRHAQGRLRRRYTVTTLPGAVAFGLVLLTLGLVGALGSAVVFAVAALPVLVVPLIGAGFVWVFVLAWRRCDRADTPAG